jgi:hypothetical protein
MNFEKVSLTLYDVFGYIVPGYVMLLVASLAESTFGKTGFLSLSDTTDNVLISIIAAYFLGNICHSIGSLLREWLWGSFSPSSRDLAKMSIILVVPQVWC